MSNETRYTIDRVGTYDWHIIDGKDGQSPRVYFLYAAALEAPLLNCQMVLTSFDGAQALNNGWPTFEREIWSTRLYVENGERAIQLAYEIYETLDDAEIQDPLELVYIFGGTVGSRDVICPPRLLSESN
jgi:hypothetical protein